jgi:hypothetical protein
MNESGNVFSQFGEDKLIADVLDSLAKVTELDNWACEFGAWDGLYLSNTANLIINEGFSAVLIEADSKKYQVLKTNMQPYPVECINAFVGFEGENSLDNLLVKTGIPLNFDLLSIDVDGVDYWILESLKNYTPKVIVIEFNPTIPKEIEFINPRSEKISQGSSIKSLVKLANSKNYDVVGMSICNLILVRREYKEALHGKVLALQNLPDPAFITRIWQTFDGKIHTEKDMHLLWHDLHISSKSLQVLPKFFIEFPENMSMTKRFFFSNWKKLYLRVRAK